MVQRRWIAVVVRGGWLVGRGCVVGGEGVLGWWGGMEEGVAGGNGVVESMCVAAMMVWWRGCVRLR